MTVYTFRFAIISMPAKRDDDNLITIEHTINKGGYKLKFTERNYETYTTLGPRGYYATTRAFRSGYMMTTKMLRDH